MALVILVMLAHLGAAKYLHSRGHQIAAALIVAAAISELIALYIIFW